MFRTSALIMLSTVWSLIAVAQEPMTAEQVSAQAKSGIEFVDNRYITTRQAENSELMLIDVRTLQEFELGHIPGAMHIPRGKAEFEIARTVRDADAEIIVYCKTGSRAALVKKALDAQGYRNVSAHGGFETWSEAGEPFENALGLMRLRKDE